MTQMGRGFWPASRFLFRCRLAQIWSQFGRTWSERLSEAAQRLLPVQPPSFLDEVPIHPEGDVGGRMAELPCYVQEGFVPGQQQAGEEMPAIGASRTGGSR